MRSDFTATIVLAVLLMGIICMMILPIPAWMLDVGLALSFALAILMFTITLFIERPLDFSAFPTILLTSLVLRLALNVASTKLIIGEGHTGTSAAGEVIEGFAMFIMGGDVIIGLIVFSVLLIVNFMVINKGATRMAEVGARFALDAMPGKQMAIDSDVAAGAINHDQARQRRDLEQAETTFFGSLDGTSKFVKGDAIAGLLITGLNLIVGFLIGIISHDMPASQAFETYSILTVGDGLVSQIPAVLISIAAALLLARGGAHGATDQTLIDQLGRYPGALGTVALLLLVFGFVPGLPFVPFVAGSVTLAAITTIAFQRRQKLAEEQQSQETQPKDTPRPETLGDILDLEEVHIEFARNLVPMALDPATGMETRITNMRHYLAKEFGMLLPEVRLTDSDLLAQNTYVVRILGVEQASGQVFPDRRLVLLATDNQQDLEGIPVAEPVYGADAIWIDPQEEETAALADLTIIQPAEVLATHLLEIVKANFSRLLTLSTLQKLISEMTQLASPERNASNQRLLDELLPDKVPLDLLLTICRSLLDEGVSIRNLALILEATAQARTIFKTVDDIYEHVRQRLGFQITAQLKRSDGTLPLIQISNSWEEEFQKYEIRQDSKQTSDIALPPQKFHALLEGINNQIETTSTQDPSAAILVNSKRRKFIQNILSAKGVKASVISYEELSSNTKTNLLGVVDA